MELFQELNQKFQTLDRFRDIPNTSSLVSGHCFIGADAVLGIQERKIEKKKKSPNGALNCTQRQIRNNRILKFLFIFQMFSSIRSNWNELYIYIYNVLDSPGHFIIRAKSQLIQISKELIKSFHLNAWHFKVITCNVCNLYNIIRGIINI